MFKKIILSVIINILKINILSTFIINVGFFCRIKMLIKLLQRQTMLRIQRIKIQQVRQI